MIGLILLFFEVKLRLNWFELDFSFETTTSSFHGPDDLAWLVFHSWSLSGVLARPTAIDASLGKILEVIVADSHLLAALALKWVTSAWAIICIFYVVNRYYALITSFGLFDFFLWLVVWWAMISILQVLASFIPFYLLNRHLKYLSIELDLLFCRASISHRFEFFSLSLHFGYDALSCLP